MRKLLRFFIFQPILFTLSLVFGFIVQIKNWAFKLKILQVKRLSIPVISVGNISVGGSGKTAVVLEILKHWPELCVLTRGYKSKTLRQNSVPCFVADASHPDLFGDEPTLLKKHNPSTKIVIDPNRYRGAQYALAHTSNISGFVLDDGFQHQYLYRDLNILLLDLDMLIHQPGLLPLGSFREQFNSIKRADFILLTKWMYLKPEDLKFAEQKLKTLGMTYDFLKSNLTRAINFKGESLSAKKIVLISALGQPKIFEKDFAHYFPDISIIEHYKFPDHYKYQTHDITEILDYAKNQDCSVVCTEKDYVKIQDLKLGLDNLYYTIQSVEYGEKLQAKLKKTLGKVIESVPC